MVVVIIPLPRNNFEVDAFNNAQLALEYLDIKMPKMNGFQLYREIKKIVDKVKVCFLTSGEIYDEAYADI